MQSDVMLQIFAVWAKEQSSNPDLSGQRFSRAINIAERKPLWRTPAGDDTGRATTPKWVVRRGSLKTGAFRPQGEYKKSLQTEPSAMWNCLSVLPSKHPVEELLGSDRRGFYVSQVLGLVIGQETGKRHIVQASFGGFDISKGRLVGELRWIERTIPLRTLFGSVAEVGDTPYHGSWKWSDGWYSCPAAVFEDLFTRAD
jgi:predicted Zn-dependent protease